jgi:hypothetical protein
MVLKDIGGVLISPFLGHSVRRLLIIECIYVKPFTDHGINLDKMNNPICDIP